MENQKDKNISPLEESTTSIVSIIFSNNGKLVVGLFVGIIIGWMGIPFISEQILERYDIVLSFLAGVFVLSAAIFIFLIWNIRNIQQFLFGEDVEFSKLKNDLNDFTSGMANGLVDKYYPENKIIKKEAAKKLAPKIGNYFVWSFLRGWGYRQLLALFGILLTFLTIIVAVQQNNLVEMQNEIVERQNKQMFQQTNLQEAERRSSLVFLFSNIMDALNDELKEADKTGNKRELSKQLIGRIISLSQRLEPYRFLENNELIENPVSPERGQLFTNLLKSGLDNETLNQILTEGNFQYSIFNGVTLNNQELKNVDLSNSVFIDVEFQDISFVNFVLNNIIIKKPKWKNVEIINSDLKNVEIKDGSLEGVRFVDSKMEEMQLNSVTVISLLDFHTSVFNKVSLVFNHNYQRTNQAKLNFYDCEIFYLSLKDTIYNDKENFFWPNNNNVNKIDFTLSRIDTLIFEEGISPKNINLTGTKINSISYLSSGSPVVLDFNFDYAVFHDNTTIENLQKYCSYPISYRYKQNIYKINNRGESLSDENNNSNQGDTSYILIPQKFYEFKNYSSLEFYIFLKLYSEKFYSNDIINSIDSVSIQPYFSLIKKLCDYFEGMKITDNKTIHFVDQSFEYDSKSYDEFKTSIKSDLNLIEKNNPELYFAYLLIDMGFRINDGIIAQNEKELIKDFKKLFTLIKENQDYIKRFYGFSTHIILEEILKNESYKAFFSSASFSESFRKELYNMIQTEYLELSFKRQ